MSDGTPSSAFDTHQSSINSILAGASVSVSHPRFRLAPQRPHIVRLTRPRAPKCSAAAVPHALEALPMSSSLLEKPAASDNGAAAAVAETVPPEAELVISALEAAAGGKSDDRRRHPRRRFRAVATLHLFSDTP